MKKPVNFRVFPAILLGMIAGISFLILTDLIIPAAVTAIAIVGAVAGNVVLRKRNVRSAKSAVAFFICFVVGLTAGLTVTAVSNYTLRKDSVFEKNVCITARIKTGNSDDLSGVITGSKVILTDLTIDGKEYDGDAQLTSLQISSGDYYEGDIIEFYGDVTTVSSVITTPFSASRLSRGIIYSVSASEGEDGVEITKLGNRLGVFDKIKKAVAQRLAENVPDGTARFMYAMMFGDSAVMEDSVRETFSQTGTAHLLAVSGLHVGILAGALMWILKKLRLNGYIRSAIVTVFLLFFCAVCGFTPSVVRATVMLLVYNVATLTGMRYDKLSALAFSAIVILLFSPLSLYSLGFIMSFCAVTGLILFAEPFKKAFLKIKMPRVLASALSATFAANVTLLPVIIYTFGNTSLIFALSNCVIVPVIGVVFPLYAVALILSFIPYFGWILTGVSFAFTAIIYIVNALSQATFITLNLDITWIGIILWLAVAFIVSPMCFTNRTAKKIIASVCFIAIVSVAAVQNFHLLTCDSEVTAFGSYESAGVLVETKEGDFLVLTGKLDAAFVTTAAQTAEERGKLKIDGIVKHEITEKETEYIKELCKLTGAKAVYSDRVFSADIVALPVGALRSKLDIVSSDIGIHVYTEEVCIYITSYDVDVFSGSEDIIISPLMTEKPAFAGYLVSDNGCISGAKDCLPSHFTFWIKGDRIIKTNKWRFA